MTALVDVVNRALQVAGTRTNVSASELTNNSSNEAIQANLIATKFRDSLLRMAPWNCGMNTANLTYISSLPGTPENTGALPSRWFKGQPAPPWIYEYQYPNDCLRACWVVPSLATNTTGGIPIFPITTGQPVSTWTGPAVKFKVGIDQFYPVTAAAVSAGGSGYTIGDLITLAQPNFTFLDTGTTPPTSITYAVGAPVVLQVATIGGGGAVATVSVVNQIIGESSPMGGSYFSPTGASGAQGSTTGSGTGATFNLTFGSQGDQRVILCNQEFACLNYIRQVTDPNVMDEDFIEAWACVIGSRLALQLSGDKAQANHCISLANTAIVEARKVDANEGLTVNDVTPDWIRNRGINFPGAYEWSPNTSFDWGGVWPSYS